MFFPPPAQRICPSISRAAGQIRLWQLLRPGNTNLLEAFRTRLEEVDAVEQRDIDNGTLRNRC
jgi:hypothetical protein